MTKDRAWTEGRESEGPLRTTRPAFYSACVELALICSAHDSARLADTHTPLSHLQCRRGVTRTWRPVVFAPVELARANPDHSIHPRILSTESNLHCTLLHTLHLYNASSSHQEKLHI